MPQTRDCLAERDGFEPPVPLVFARKRRLPANFGSLSAPIRMTEPGPENDRAATSYEDVMNFLGHRNYLLNANSLRMSWNNRRNVVS